MQTTKNFTSKHPQLHQLMSNLYGAGMGIERVIEFGFDFAQTCLCENNEPFSTSMLTASAQVLDVANELGMSRTQQYEASCKARSAEIAWSPDFISGSTSTTI